MDKIKITPLICLLTLILVQTSCKKYLDAKPDKALVVPGTTSDLQALLNNTLDLNMAYPAAGETAADDYYLTTPDWLSLNTTDKNTYVWDRNLFNDDDRNDWSLSYAAVYTANVVLNRVEDGNVVGPPSDLGHVKGQALFFRAYAFHQLLQVFAKPYNKISAETDLGIALRLSATPDIVSVRATVQQSYQQVLGDLHEAVMLLPPTPLVKTRPSRSAAFALLARVYLQMEAWELAARYADSALAINHTLIDYNTVNGSTGYPFELFNKEVIFHTIMYTNEALNNERARIDSMLYSSYEAGDLRRLLFFRNNNDGTASFRGSYAGSVALFNGLAVNELLLVKAEAAARMGQTELAMQVLNTLLEKRWASGSFQPLTAGSAAEALEKVLEERRKELLMRGLRWPDLRRLNTESRFQKTLIRVVDGKTHTLTPNSNRYTLPLPSKVVRMSGMPQNPG